jgi:hypothetical protein
MSYRRTGPKPTMVEYGGFAGNPVAGALGPTTLATGPRQATYNLQAPMPLPTIGEQIQQALPAAVGGGGGIPFWVWAMGIGVVGVIGYKLWQRRRGG